MKLVVLGLAGLIVSSVVLAAAPSRAANSPFLSDGLNVWLVTSL
jgi:hypothetical protein